MPSLDIFNDDAFNVVSMTKAINEQPHVPGRIGELKLFSEEGISTTSLFIEKQGNTLSLVPNTPRGSSGDAVGNEKRSLVPIGTTHLPQRATVVADEVQNVRAFGSESEVETVQNVVNKRLAKARRNIDATIEYQRVGAIKGKVMDADGTTEILDLFTLLGVTQQTHNLVLNNASTKVRNKIVEGKRKIETELGGMTYRSLRAFCSPAFFDALVGHGAVEAAYDRWLDGQFMREDVRAGFFYAGVFWEEYRGKVGSIDFITDGEAYLVPEGVPDLFVTNFAPADYMETVNTIGLPYYAKQEVLRMNKGVEIESQSNPISICTRPRTIIKLAAS